MNKSLAERIFAALQRADGTTFHLPSGSPAVSGFAVCIEKRALHRAVTPTLADVECALAAAQDAGAEYLGTWRHPRGEVVFLHTVVTEDESVARELVERTGQYAYFDLAAGRELSR